tara:strand:+ start:44196 stop:44330 length:135 start_codon:yes stop_codon:yes gene_type:complete
MIYKFLGFITALFISIYLVIGWGLRILLFFIKNTLINMFSTEEK